MRSVVRGAMAVVALAAAALSYQSLAHLGELAGYAGLSILYPLVVDAGAAASCAAWLHTRGRQPLAMTWALLAVSVVLNGTTHYLESTRTAPSWLLVVAVAAVPPTVLGLCVHLAVGLGAPGLPAASRVNQQAGLAPIAPEAPTSPEILVTQVTPEATASFRDTRDSNDPVAELIESGAGRRQVAAELNITEYRARQLITSRRNGDGR